MCDDSWEGGRVQAEVLGRQGEARSTFREQNVTRQAKLLVKRPPPGGELHQGVGSGRRVWSNGSVGKVLVL